MKCRPVFPSVACSEDRLCFFHDAIAALVADGTLTRVTELRTEMSPQPVYELEEAGQRLTLVHPPPSARRWRRRSWKR